MSDTYRDIGILGGLSPEATAKYYAKLIAMGHERVGPDMIPRIVITSVKMGDYNRWEREGKWDRIAEGLQFEFEALRAAGCDFAAIACNTAHKMLPTINPPLPVLSIIDATADAIRERGVKRIGLTGTIFTMSDGFYQKAMSAHGLECITPEADDQAEIHRFIYEELARGILKETAVHRFATIARDLQERGAEVLLLACTELGMLTAHDAWPEDIPTLDTIDAHVEAIFRAARGERSLFPMTSATT